MGVEALPPPCCVVASPCLNVEVLNSLSRDNIRPSLNQSILAYMVKVRRTGDRGSRQWRRGT